MAVRVAVAVVAVVVVAWLAVMERDARVQASGLSAVHAGKLSKADSRLRSARFLNPDTTPDLSRALLLLGQRQPARAAALLRDVVRREPDNISAWAELRVVSRGSDPATVSRATAVLERLDPLDAPRR